MKKLLRYLKYLLTRKDRHLTHLRYRAWIYEEDVVRPQVRQRLAVARQAFYDSQKKKNS